MVYISVIEKDIIQNTRNVHFCPGFMHYHKAHTHAVHLCVHISWFIESRHTVQDTANEPPWYPRTLYHTYI